MTRMTINGKVYNASGDNMSIINGKVIVGGEEVTDIGDSNTVKIVIDGDINKLYCDKSVNVDGNVSGTVNAGGSVSCDDINGDVYSSGSTSCDSVKGNVSAGGSVNCDRVGGSVTAGGSVNHG